MGKANRFGILQNPQNFKLTTPTFERAGKMKYERDDNFESEFPSDSYKISGHGGISWTILGYEISPDIDTEWSGYEPRTGNVVAVMNGDDQRWSISPDDHDIIALDDGEFCNCCGQIGCQWG